MFPTISDIFRVICNEIELEEWKKGEKKWLKGCYAWLDCTRGLDSTPQEDCVDIVDTAESLKDNTWKI